MRYLFLFLFASLALIACNSSNKTKGITKEELKERVASLEDSIVLLQKQQKQVPLSLTDTLIQKLKDYYHLFPNDKSAPKCLDKIQMIYSAEGRIKWSVDYADTLLLKYPKYENRALIIESQAANYDMFIIPRDTNKVRKYFQMLLDENSTIEKSKRAGIELRLKNLGMTFDRFIEYQNKMKN